MTDQASFYEGSNGELNPNTPEKMAEKRRLRAGAVLGEGGPYRFAREAAQISRLTHAGKHHAALEVFRGVNAPDKFLYDTVLNACSKGSMRSEAAELWSEMRPDQKCVVSYTCMLELCKRTRQVRQGERIFREMRSAGVAPNLITYNMMVGLYGATSSPDMAYRLFEEAHVSVLREASPVSKQMAYLAVMAAAARVGDYGKARGYYVRMVEEGVEPKIMHMNALLSACSPKPDPDTAQAIFDLFPKMSMVPRLEDYAVLLTCNRLNLPRCLEIMAEIEQAGLKPNGKIYQQMFEAHVTAEDVQGGRELLTKSVGMDWASPRVRQLAARLQELGAQRPVGEGADSA